MRLRSLAVAALGLLSSIASASSTARNPLSQLGAVRNATIHTQNHRVTALSHFDLSLALFDGRVKLSLEPNHDILADGASVQYLGPDGQVVRTEAIQRLDHKVFKGTAWVERSDEWHHVGWARVVVRRDGIDPLFEGHFTINHDHHHVQLSSNYARTKHALDPAVLDAGSEGEFMVAFRDSDIMDDQEVHQDLKRSEGSSLACRSDSLEFNTAADHPVFAPMLRRDDDFWSAPISSLFVKRQLDNLPGSGNSAGVNLLNSIGSSQGCPNTRKVALVGVATDCTYTGSFNSTETARQNVITQINSASDLYERTFNITLGLQNLTVSDATCPGSVQQASPWNQPCSANLDIQGRLNLFSAWRGTKQDTNSHWTLLSTCNTGSAVGLAWLGQACVNTAQTSNSTKGGGSETVSGANVVVRTSTEWQVIAHETGHTFGAVHDCTSQTCNDGSTVNAQQCCPMSSSTCDAQEKYIMNPSTARGITQFSPCSIGNICSAMGRNSVKTNCFSNNKGVVTISGRQCGNGIVEDGEDCDCGGAASCGNNSCCDAATCKFKNNAVCDDSNEDCCKNCQYAAADTVCRASTGVCDPTEKCTGSSPYCPKDVTNPDGQDCGNGLKCASGQCTSRDKQCKTVMGSYTTGNDTFACDSMSCSLSCASPQFGLGVCYGLQQNFLDGTPCGGGGHCLNGQCKGSSPLKEVGSWITDHKALVIGVSVALGVLLLLSIFSCIVSSIRRRKQRRKMQFSQAQGAAAPAQQMRYSRQPAGFDRGQQNPNGAQWNQRSQNGGQWNPRAQNGDQWNQRGPHDFGSGWDGPRAPQRSYTTNSVRYA